MAQITWIRRLVISPLLFALAIIVGTTAAIGWLDCILLYFSENHHWPHGAPIPLLPDWTLKLPGSFTNRWWDVPLVALLSSYAVLGSHWLVRIHHHPVVASAVSGGLLLIGITATMTITGQWSLLDAMLRFVLPLSALLGAGAGFEYGTACWHDVRISLITAGPPAACLPGLWSFGLLPGLLVAGPILLVFAAGLIIGVSFGAVVSSPFRALTTGSTPSTDFIALSK